MTITDEIKRYLDFHKARSRHTARAYQTGLEHFLAYLVGISVEDLSGLTREVATDFLVYLADVTYERGDEQIPLAMRTRQLYVRAVSGLYKQLAQEGKIPLTYADYVLLNDELSEATRFQEKPIEEKLPGKEDVAAIIQQAEKQPNWDHLTADMQQWKRTIWMRNRAIVQLLFSSGMRVGELCSLRVGDLEDQGAWVTGKGDKRRFVRFGGTAWDRLQSYLKYRGNTNKTHPLLQRHDTACGDKILPLSVLSVQRIVSHLADDAGIKRKFTPHAFRHFFASTFLAQTHDLA